MRRYPTMSYPRCMVLAALFGCSTGAPLADKHPPPRVKAGPTAEIVVDEIEPLAADPEPEPEPESGKRLGRYQLTYYHVARQRPDDRSRAVPLRDRRGKVLARVSRKFSRRLQMQGTGRLTDGRLINVAGGCRKSKRCYHVLADDIEYGIGARNKPLQPFRSVAAPPHIAFGTVLYIPELDGLAVPGGMQDGSYVHDGCVVAEDRGGGIRGRQLDLFTADGNRYRLFHRRNKIVRVTVHRGGERCAELADQPAPRVNRGRG